VSPASRRADSLAGRAFGDAEDLLHSLAFPSSRLTPSFELVVLPAPRRRPPAADGADAAAAPAAGQLPDDRAPASRSRGGGSAAVVRPRLPPLLSKAPTLADAARELAGGRSSTRELVERSIEVATSTSELGTVVAIDEELALAEADALDRERAAGRLRGVLHGLPVTVKDIIDVAGLPTHAGSEAYFDPDPQDAASVARLRAAGALILAKVATHEFALGVTTPQCRNPHDPSRISGGSSGGSAIAVATGVGLASLGTDTRASLRVPAHCCGVVGFKPTFGRVPASGIVPLSWTIDHIGPMTRTVEDAAIMLNVLAGEPFLDPRPSLPGGFTVGLVTEVLEEADPDVAAACEAALQVLEAAGARLVELDVPAVGDLELANALGLLVSRAEAASFHRSQQTDLDACIPEVRDQLAAGLTISAADYLDAQRQRRVLAARSLAAFAACDVLAVPTAPIVAPRLAEYERYLLRLSRNTIIWCPAVGRPRASRSGCSSPPRRGTNRRSSPAAARSSGASGRGPDGPPRLVERVDSGWAARPARTSSGSPRISPRLSRP
jgi:aspartyl-tRNA(Asn)/glutamyl-tRNA(Gln) amidotransferase subunit A